MAAFQDKLAALCIALVLPDEPVKASSLLMRSWKAVDQLSLDGHTWASGESVAPDGTGYYGRLTLL